MAALPEKSGSIKATRAPLRCPTVVRFKRPVWKLASAIFLPPTCSSLGINGVSALSGTETYQGLPMPSTQSTSVAICFERLCL